MSDANKRRAKQLGMSYGAAAGKLRKNLMFRFAQELGYDNCFACGEKIEAPDDLSLEHKEPWEGRENGNEKFWDLDNIAFSHLKCNVSHNDKKSPLRKNGPEGTAWCNKHQDFISVENFGSSSYRWNGLKGHCRSCDAQDKRKKRKNT